MTFCAYKTQKKKSLIQLSLETFAPRLLTLFSIDLLWGLKGILIVWKGALFFRGVKFFQNEYAISIEFTSKLNNASWILTTDAPDDKRRFLDWFKNIQMPDDIDWLIVGDFNLIRRPKDRNKEERDIMEMFQFNEAISTLGLNELPLLGRHDTWNFLCIPGVPGKVLLCKRGVGRGDRLSPLLFLQAADLPHSILNKGKDVNLLKFPVPLSCSSDYPIIQYADDTLIVMEACSRQPITLKAHLHSFWESTWLKVNYSKSVMVPINIQEDRLQHLAGTFNCDKGSLPFTYLGLHRGLTKPKVIDFPPGKQMWK